MAYRKRSKKFIEDTYPNLKPTYRIVKTSESEKGEIGHINFFRSYNRKLWDIILKELVNE
jgi:predicted alpha/beta hydrolase